MLILGIDPGYDRLGIAILEKPAKGKETVVFSACLQTSSKDSIYERLKAVGSAVAETIEKHRPDVLAMESLFLSANQKTAMRVAEARGIVIYEATKAGLPIFEYSPMQIKTAVTGDGSSDKGRMIKMVGLLVDLPKKKSLDDEYDAVAVALTHSAVSRP